MTTTSPPPRRSATDRASLPPDPGTVSTGRSSRRPARYPPPIVAAFFAAICAAVGDGSPLATPGACELSHAATADPTALPTYVATLARAEYSRDVACAVDGLVRLGEAAESAVPVLVARLRIAAASCAEMKECESPPDEIRALVAIGAPAVPALGQLAADDDFYLAAWGATALEQLGPAARDALAPLATCAQRPEIDPRWHCLRALGALADPRALPFLALAVQAESPDVRVAAARALERLGPAAAAAAPALRAAAHLLPETNPERNVYLAALDAIVGEPAVRQQLERLGEEAQAGSREAIAALVNLVVAATEDTELLPAARELASLGAVAVSPVVARLAGATSSARINLVIVLREIGPAAAEALPALERLAHEHHDDTTVRVVDDALHRIRGPDPDPSASAAP